jgi:3-hydroxyacyl-CoA dehydrogenase
MSHASIERVAVVATGVIGASWVTAFLARGLEVIATDPAPDAEAKLRATVASHWPAMEAAGLAPGASLEKLCFTTSPEEAVATADFVQENGPERLDFKRELFRRIDAAAPPHALLASSSSTLMVSDFQNACEWHPERVVLGHPFNPPHLIPLVEVVGGSRTSQATIDRAMAFYAAIGKRPIHIRKEVKGHVANRLQAALWREAVHLVAEGVASVGDIDAAIASGPGLRWAQMGPHLTFHLAGGRGGMEHFLAQFAGPIQGWWQDLGAPVLTPEVQRKLVDGVADETRGRSIAALESERDEHLISLLSSRRSRS